MRFPFRHPRASALEDFARGTAAAPTRADTAAHLERCVRCRNTVRLIRRLNDQTPVRRRPADTALLDRVLASRAAGSRVVLPAADLAHGRRRTIPRIAAAAVLLSAIGLTAVFGTRDAVAGAWTGDLQIAPSAPRHGATLSVVYRPSEALAGEQVLRLRARLRTPGNHWYDAGIPIRTVALLTRQDDGTFTGTFALPDSVIFAALAVEDTTGSHVDSNDRRAWEVLVHGDDGRPSLAALEQRVADLMGRSWEDAHATVIRMTELYPEDYPAWELRRLFDEWLHPNAVDSINAVYADTLARLAASLRSRAGVPVRVLERLTYVTFTRDSTAHAYWRARLVEADPRNQQLQQLRTVELARAHQDDPRRLLTALDTLWSDLGPAWGAGRLMVLTALNAARRSDDVEGIRRWAERLRYVERDFGDPTIRSFITQPELRQEGMKRLRAELTRLAAASEAERGLGETARRYRLRLEDVRRRMLGDLGAALLEEGDVRAGLDTLALATARGWNRALFRRAGDARLASGDTLGALQMYALLAADPRTVESTRDSLDRVAGLSIGVAEWSALLGRARAEMPTRVLERADPSPLRRSVRLAGRDGRLHDFAGITRGAVTLVVFWSRNCLPVLEELPQVDSIAARLAERGVRVVSITDEAPSQLIDQFVSEKRLTMPVYYDVHGEAREAFSSFGTPAYYMLDTRGRIRFRYANPVDDLLVQAEALSLE